MGRFLRDHGLLPDLVLCSAARRARETRDAVLSAAGSAPALKTDEAVTQGDESALLARIRDISGKCETVLVIGHNPTIHGLACILATAGPQEARKRLAHVYSPGTLTVLDLAAESWNEAGRGDGMLRDLFDPRADTADHKVPG